MKKGWIFLFGLVSGLLGAGVIFLAAQPPRGTAILLNPPPTASPLTVQVSGAVKNPGLYTLPPESRVVDAIEAAGGVTADAQMASVNLAALLQDGDRVWVTSSTENLVPSNAGSSLMPGSINLNTASPAELESLPGIGPATAQKIITYRQVHGLFSSTEEIMDVPGIGQATFDNIRDYITIGP